MQSIQRNRDDLVRLHVELDTFNLWRDAMRAAHRKVELAKIEQKQLDTSDEAA